MERLNRAYTMVRANTALARQQFKKQYDKRAKNLQYQVGDKVLLDIRKVNKNQSKKLVAKYEGPYRILKTFNNGTVTIKGDGTTQTVNVARIKPLFETMIWKEERTEPFKEIKKLPRTTEQYTSTDDIPTTPQNNDTISTDNSDKKKEPLKTADTNNYTDATITNKTDNYYSPTIAENTNREERRSRTRNIRTPKRFDDFIIHYKTRIYYHMTLLKH